MRIKSILLGSLVTISGLSYASSHGLSEILEIARSNDAGYRSKLQGFEADKIGNKISQRSLYPTLDFSLSGDISSQTGEPTVSLSAPVLDYGKNTDRKLGSVALDATMIKEASYKQSYILSVATAYFDVLNKYAALNAAQAEYQQLTNNYEKVSDMHSSGMKTPADKLSAKANLDDSHVRVLEATSDFKLAKGSLSRMVNQPIDELEGLAPETILKFEGLTPQEVYEKAQAKNLDLAESRVALNTAQLNLEKTNAKFLPTLTFSASVKQSLSDQVVNLSNKTLSGSAALKFNIYNGGKDSMAAEQKALEMMASEDNLENAVYDMSVNSAKVVSQFENAKAKLVASQTAEQSAMLQLDAMNEKHISGEASELELFNAITGASKASKNRTEAGYNLVLKYMDMLQLTGELNDDAVNEINGYLSESISFDSGNRPSSASDLAASLLTPSD